MKLVKESISRRALIFKRGLDPHDSLGVGRKSLIINWLQNHDIINYDIIRNNLINCEYVNLYDNNFNDLVLPDYIQFNNIEGSFACYQTNLSSLKGFPNKIGLNFAIDFTNINSLEYFPKFVEGAVIIYNNHHKFNEEDINSVCEFSGISM